MTEHVLECRWESQRCICEELRACEQRVKQSITGLSWYSKARWTGYYEGIDAAREAVAASWTGWCPDPTTCTDYEHVCGERRNVLAAIDALKEKP